MKVIHRLFILFILLYSEYAYSQQSVVYAHFDYISIDYNPAFAGYEGGTTFSGVYRQQWVNYPGAPVIFQLNSDFSLFQKSVGLALSYQNINESVFIRQKLLTAYAYKVPLNSKETMFLRIGLNVLTEYYMQSSDLNIITPNNNIDPAFSPSFSSRFNFNVGTGILLQLNNLILGVSTLGIIDNTTLFDSNYIDAVSNQPIYSHLSYKIKFTEGFTLTPMTLIRYENNRLGLDNRLKITINNMIIFGLNYRYMGDFGVTIGLIMNASLKLGYGYEPNIITSDSKVHAGTHEIVFKYRIFKRNYKIDSPRYLQ